MIFTTYNNNLSSSIYRQPKEVREAIRDVEQAGMVKTKWIPFSDMYKKQPKWREFTKADAKKVVKSNIKQILSYKEYLLTRNEDPKVSEVNLKNLEKILLSTHAGIESDMTCAQLMKLFN